LFGRFFSKILLTKLTTIYETSIAFINTLKEIEADLKPKFKKVKDEANPEGEKI
jgi:hypothetical protein